MLGIYAYSSMHKFFFILFTNPKNESIIGHSVAALIETYSDILLWSIIFKHNEKGKRRIQELTYTCINEATPKTGDKTHLVSSEFSLVW